MFDGLQLYSGRSGLSMPALGDPRIFGIALIALVFAAGAIVAIATGMDLSHIGLAGLAFGLGPVSVDLKEAAAAKWMEAADLESEDGTVASEDQGKYDAAVQAAMDLDGQVAKAEKAEGTHSTIQERLAFYHGKATGQTMRFASTQLDPRAAMSLGEQFVSSESYKKLESSGAFTSKNQSIGTDPVSLYVPNGRGGYRAAATDVINTDADATTVALAQPARLPGVYAWGQRPLTIRDVFPNDTTEADSIEYVAQTSRDVEAGALTVKESTSPTDAAGKKKQFSIGTEIRTAHAEIIAVWAAATRKSLGNRDALRAFIDNQGRYILALEEEDQIINGNGTRPNLSGLLDQSDRLTLDIGTIGLDNLDGVRRAKRLVRTGLSRLPATFAILNPVDSEGFDLLKDDFGIYRGGNPIGNFDENQTIWRLRRVESEAVDEGKAIIGSAAAATIFQRRPITVYTADQHSDFFVRNLVVILFEEELAMPVYFPTALCEVTLEDWPQGS
jgi:HK97 family phage major capsid protein